MHRQSLMQLAHPWMHRLVVCALAATMSACAIEPDEVDSTSVESAATVTQWLDDVQVPNQMSAREPALAYYGGKLHMVHNGNTYPNDLWWSTFDGATWSPNVKLSGFESDGGPALVPYAGRLYMAFHRAGANELDISTTAGGSWTTPSVVHPPYYVTFRHAPSATVYGTKLYVASCFTSTNGNQGIILESFDGTTWSNTIVDTAMYWGTCEAVALQPIDGQLHLLTTWHYHSTYLGTTLIDQTPIYEAVLLPTYAEVDGMYMDSRLPPAMTTCNGYVFLVHSGDSTPDQIWWSYRPATGGGSWSPNERLTNQTSDGGSGIGCFDGTPIIAHNGGTNQLWWASYR